MALFTEDQVRTRASSVTSRLNKSAGRVLAQDSAPRAEPYDVFLSHSSSEPQELLLGIKTFLEDAGLSVYVDKYDDPQMSPDKVTADTAEVLRRRMRQSLSLLYVYSQHSTRSRWMPWELGFFDGLKGKVGIIPIMRDAGSSFKGEEYLSLYPYVDRAKVSKSQEQVLWINRNSEYYAQLKGWIVGTEMIKKHAA
ncbi:toll/interleukin-1 receptor domain-containing protein [Rhodopseudomonas pseudopalustris]|uniref:toll/interleukin-1 receptor domain-containing protein n=1 Tax=Rhodopseudomonas pseudopalustris TaxID=1513892 RepID=UPI003F9E9AF1